VSFLKCGGQIGNNLCQISSRFFVPNIIKIGSFLTKLSKKLQGGIFLYHSVQVYISHSAGVLNRQVNRQGVKL